MKVILGIVIVVFAALALASSDKKDAVKVVDLAEELAKSRQELAKSREETKEIIQSESDKLRREDNKLKAEADQLRRKNKKLEQEVVELRREMRDADAKITKSMRQRDENNALELQNIVRNSLRQNDFTSELKKLMKKEIKEHLDETIRCEAKWKTFEDYKAEITFARPFNSPPSFMAAFNRLAGKGYMSYNGLASKTGITLSLSDYIDGAYEVTWIACGN